MSNLRILLLFKTFFTPLFSAFNDILKARVFEDLSAVENYLSPSVI